MILGKLLFLIGILSVWVVDAKKKKKKQVKSSLPQLLDNLVINEVEKKLPVSVKKSHASKRNRLTGAHMKAATDAINKLVDESIVDRVEEAEKEVSHMLLKNIEHHIKDAGKIFLKDDEKEQPGHTRCKDKLDSCDKLSSAGVCKTSKDAMIESCPRTCNYCHLVLDSDTQGKLLKELEEHKNDKETLLSIKFKNKKNHRKHTEVGESTEAFKLPNEEIGMLGQQTKEDQSSTLELSPQQHDSMEPTETSEHHSQQHDEDLKETEEKEDEEEDVKKEREDAKKLLAAEKKIREEEIAQEMEKKHHKKKKKAMVHKSRLKSVTPDAVTNEGSKGISFPNFGPANVPYHNSSIPFLNEDPYPLIEFVSAYERTGKRKEIPTTRTYDGLHKTDKYKNKPHSMIRYHISVKAQPDDTLVKDTSVKNVAIDNTSTNSTLAMKKHSGYNHYKHDMNKTRKILTKIKKKHHRKKKHARRNMRKEKLEAARVTNHHLQHNTATTSTLANKFAYNKANPDVDIQLMIDRAFQEVLTSQKSK